jgi:hypothetical protein
MAWRYEDSPGTLGSGVYDLITSCLNTIGTDMEEQTMQSVWDYFSQHYFTPSRIRSFINELNPYMWFLNWISVFGLEKTFSMMYQSQGYLIYGSINTSNTNAITIDFKKISFFENDSIGESIMYNPFYFSTSPYLFESICSLTLVREFDHYILDFMGFVLVFDIPFEAIV